MGERRLVTRSGDGYVLHLGADERALVSRLLAELGGLLTDPDADVRLLGRLFPTVHPDHPEREAEYQRLMRDELVSSKLAGIEAVDEVLGRGGRKVTFDEPGIQAFMQAVNSVRLVLGTLLDVSDDDDPDIVGDVASPEAHLYGFLSWVLDASVHAVTLDA